MTRIKKIALYILFSVFLLFVILKCWKNRKHDYMKIFDLVEIDLNHRSIKAIKSSKTGN